MAGVMPTIDPEFAAIWPLTKDEREQLKKNVLRDGCIRDPLVVWSNGCILLDGHNRLGIAKTHDLKFSLHSIDLPDRQAALDWIEDNQLGRRNLTPARIADVQGRRYRAEKRGRGGDGSNQHSEQIRQNDGKANVTAHRLAKKHGVSPRTIERNAKFSERLDEIAKTHPEVRDDILNGKTALTRADIEELAKTEPSDRDQVLESKVDRRSLDYEARCKRVRELHAQGLSTRGIASKLDVGMTAVTKIKSDLGLAKGNKQPKVVADVERVATVLAGVAIQCESLTKALEGQELQPYQKELLQCVSSLSESRATVFQLVKALRGALK